MKKIDLGQTVSILANLGVIAGILLLAYELRQNNALLASQARSNLDANRNFAQQPLVENAGGIVDIILKARAGDLLSDSEAWRLNVRRSMLMYSYESMYREATMGPLSEGDIPALQWAATFSGDPGMQEMWHVINRNMDPDFVDFVERSVLPVADRMDADLVLNRFR